MDTDLILSLGFRNVRITL